MNTLVIIKELFAWRALLDIFLIAAVLFFLYRTLIRLGTWKIFSGILVAIAVFIVAQSMDLKGSEWIFDNLSQVAVIGFIVIFQPELRKLFERAATMRGIKNQARGGQLAEVIAEAIFRMAGQHRGAILVMPGREPLQEWLSGGFDIDATPSVPLLLSIFDPNSPGHDGALIIEDGRFHRFGARLPASQSDTLPKELGTRHNAAMGLSERSDAFIIVLSEERGVVSTFQKGEVQKINGPDQLIAAMREHWLSTSSSRLELTESKMKWLIAPQFLVSLLVAAILWVSLTLSQGEIMEKIVTVPVEYTASPANLILVGGKDKELRLHLSGLKSDLDGLNPSHLGAKIDLAKAVTGKQSFLINRDNLRLPRDVKLLDISPSAIDLTLDEIVQREVIIKPQLVGKLPPGVVIQEMTVSPQRLNVLTPAELDKGKPLILMTTPIYLDSLREDTKIFCKIIAAPSIHPVDKRWPDVEISITLKHGALK